MSRGIYRQRAGWPAVLSFVLLLLAGSPAAPAVAAGQVIENPAKPKAANAGRVIVPQEVLTISDEGTSEFFFNWPRGLRTAPDGAFLLTDKDQVLQFDTNGMFLRNLFKKGQGPGEMPYPGACVGTQKNLVVYSGYPSKLVYFSPSGQFEKEIAVRGEGEPA